MDNPADEYVKVTPLQEWVYLNNEVEALRADNLKVVAALQNLEHAVNLSVSGKQIGVTEWLDLLHKANEALGSRSLSK